MGASTEEAAAGVVEGSAEGEEPGGPTCSTGEWRRGRKEGAVLLQLHRRGVYLPTTRLLLLLLLVLLLLQYLVVFLYKRRLLF